MSGNMNASIVRKVFLAGNQLYELVTGEGDEDDVKKKSLPFSLIISDF